MALEEDIPDQPDDKTIPKYKQIDKVTNSPPPSPPLPPPLSHPPLLLSSFFQKYSTASPPH